jgi:hypothetical protein
MNFRNRTALLILCIFAFALNTNVSHSQDTAKDARTPTMSLKGTVKQNGDSYTFVNDKDEKSWVITNPEALKGYEGHHVQLNAHVYADKNTIHVMAVTMLKGGRGPGASNDASKSAPKGAPGGPPTGGDPPPQHP